MVSRAAFMLARTTRPTACREPSCSIWSVFGNLSKTVDKSKSRRPTADELDMGESGPLQPIVESLPGLSVIPARQTMRVIWGATFAATTMGLAVWFGAASSAAGPDDA